MSDRSPQEGKAEPPSVRWSLVLSFAQKYTNLLFIVPTIMIVSRLLTPAQIGVYSVAAAFVALVQSLRDFGVSDYLMQQSDLDDAIIRTAFTVTALVAWILAAVFFLSSHWIAAFYQEPSLRVVLQILCINFLLLPFGSTINALLQRSLEFGPLYRINVGQQFVQSTLTVTLAAVGFGTISLAWGAVGGMVASVLGSLVWGRAYRVKGLGLTRWRSIAHFGLHRTFSDVMVRVGIHAPDFIIGRMLGFTQVGLYSRGFGLINMFRQNVIAAIQAVAYPAFARSHRETNEAHLLFLKSLTYVSGIAWPFFAFSALMAFPIMRIMFGPQWDAAVPVLQLLAIAAFVGVPNFAFGQFFLVIGRVGLVTIATTVVQIVRVAALVVAAFYGLYAVAGSQILVSVFAVLLHCGLLLRYSAVSWPAIWKALRPSLIVTSSAMLGPVLVYALMPPSGHRVWIPLILSGASACAGWLFGVSALNHPLWLEFKHTFPRQRGQA